MWFNQEGITRQQKGRKTEDEVFGNTVITVTVQFLPDKERSKDRRRQGTVTFLESFKLAHQNYFVKCTVKLAF